MANTDTQTRSGSDTSIRERAEDTLADAKARGREAVTAFSDVADTMGDALDESLRNRPYATLAIAAGIGFLLGAAWAR